MGFGIWDLGFVLVLVSEGSGKDLEGIWEGSDRVFGIGIGTSTGIGVIRQGSGMYLGGIWKGSGIWYRYRHQH